MCKFTIDTKALKKAMIDKDIKGYIELADKANLSRNTVADVVNGGSKPNLTTIYAIADTLSLTPAQIGDIFFAQHIA